jgi:tetratricopeptide (TPR) repeat protein
VNTALLRVVFFISLAVVAAGLRWLARNPRAASVLPAVLGGGPNVVPPPLPDEATRASWAPTGYQLLGWIHDGDHARARAHLEGLAAEPAPPDGDLPALDRLLDGLPPLLSVRAALDAWCQGSPDEAWPFLVRGRVLLEAGIRARGRQRGGTVSQEAVEQMQEQLRRAWEDIQRTRQLRVDLPQAGALAVRAARFFGDADEALHHPISGDHYPSQLQGLTTRLPRWYGSEEALFDWARGAARTHPEQPYWQLLVVEAHGEMAWFETGPDSSLNREYLRQPEVRDEIARIRTSLEDAYPESGRIQRELALLANFLEDFEGSRSHRERAAALGDPDSLVDLAFEQDREARDRTEIQDRPAFEAAFQRMQRAAATGHPEALRRVGRVLRRAGRTETEFRAALDWFRLAADRGDPEAHFELGQCHMTGEGVPENRREAARWYRSGWELGSAWSAYMLAALAKGGAGTRADPPQVTLWLEEAAKLGHADARLEVGQRLLAGIGAPEAPERGRAWIQAAADVGHEAAREALAELEGADPPS